MNAVPETATVPRGLRNNNPGNLVHSSQFRWAGELSPPDGPYCRFDIPFHGLRALTKNLWSYWSRDNCKSLRQIIGRFAPPNENDTNAYLTDVAAKCDVSPDMAVDLRDQTFMFKLVTAIIQHENGQNPYTDFQVQSAIRNSD